MSGAIPVRPLRRPWRIVGGTVVSVLLAAAAWSVVTNERFQWGLVVEYVFSRRLLDGALTTLWLTALSMLIGIVLGVLLAVMRQSDVALLKAVASGYVWFFRGTPVLVQIIFWYNLAALYPVVALGIPGSEPVWQMSVNDIITPLAAGLLALGLNEAAYMSEIVRAGLLSVDDGQLEAASSLGMSKRRAMTRIILPQAMRVIIPPTGNETIGMLKTTSLVSVIAVPDLLYVSQVIYATTFQTIPVLIAASIWYLVLTSVLTLGQMQLEKRFARGTHAQATESFTSRFRATFFRTHARTGGNV